MPSFIVHSIAGEELKKKLKLTKDQEDKFFIANLLPDVVEIKIDPKWTDREIRIARQEFKLKTHFRDNNDHVLSFPNMNKFINEYNELIKTDIIVFGYFFHLYADYYYFRKYLPKRITFLDKNYNETESKEDKNYVRINKNNKIITSKGFWSLTNKDGIYEEYSRLNKYLLREYNYSLDINYYKNYLKNNEFNIKIEEVKNSNLNKLLDEVNFFYIDAVNRRYRELKIFDNIDITELISETISTFVEKYSDFMYNYTR